MKREHISKIFIQCNEATLSQTRKTAIAFCSARHSLPLNFYEEKCNEWALELKVPRDKLRREIENLYTDVKETVVKISKADMFVTFDGWTNSVTRHKHMSSVLNEVGKKRSPIFWQSFVYETGTTVEIQNELNQLYDDLKKSKIKVVGLLADIARACQSAISTIQDANNDVCCICQ